MPEHTRKVPIEAEIISPGPLAYNLPPTLGTNEHDKTKYQNPAWSIGLRTHEPVDRIPGPAYSVGDRVTHRGRQDPPAYSLTGRPHNKGIDNTPGPDHYNAGAIKPGAKSTEGRPRATTMGSRSAWYKMKNWAPAPTAYSIPGGTGAYSPAARNSARWSMYGRQAWGSPHYEDKVKGSPGPAAYTSVDASTFKRRPASYTVKGRTQMKQYNSALENPSPNHYSPLYPRSGKTGGCSMGVRHSNFTVLCLTAADM